MENKSLLLKVILKKKNYENCSILRISKTFGDNLNDGTLFTDLLLKYKNGIREFEVAYDQKFAPLYVRDLIKILDFFIKYNIKGLYNVCGDEYSSRLDLVKSFIKSKNLRDIRLKKVSISKYDKNFFFPKCLNLSNAKIKKKINFKFTKLKNVFKNIK